MELRAWKEVLQCVGHYRLVDSWNKSGVQCWKLLQGEGLHDLSKESNLGNGIVVVQFL